MTRKTRSAEAEIIEEFGEPIETQDVASVPGERVFDFTGPAQALEGDAKDVYFRLRREAILAGDESQFPDGKIYAEAEVIKILGEDYASPGVDPNCCG